MAKTKFKVSQSKVKTWWMCKRAYHYKYVEKLRKRKIKRPFTFGDLVHRMLEEKAKGNDPFKVLDSIPLKTQKLFAAEREMYGDIINDIRFIMTDYFAHYRKDGLITIRKNGVYAEHEFELDLTGDIVMTGKIDKVVKSQDTLRWLMEHKSFGRSIPQSDHLWRNLQTAVYIKVLNMLDWKPVDGVLWDYIYSKPPGRPKVTKKGEISKQKLIMLPSSVRFALEQNGLDPEDHKPLLALAKRDRGRYFKRIKTPVNEEVVESIFEGFVDTAKDIADNHGKNKTRHFGRHCEWCDFEPICRAELTGADADYLREKDYYVETKEVKEKLIIEEDA